MKKSATPNAQQSRPTSAAKPMAASKPKEVASDIKASSPKAPRASSKIGTLIELLRGKKGASIDQLVKATGWQAHSVRGALSGTIKKKMGLKVLSEKNEQGRIYRVVG